MENGFKVGDCIRTSMGQEGVCLGDYFENHIKVQLVNAIPQSDRKRGEIVVYKKKYCRVIKYITFK